MYHLLFSYGTLQKESVQHQLFGRILDGSKDVLPGYTLAAVQITDEAFLAKGEAPVQQTIVRTGSEKDFINGMALELTEEELSEADKYEPTNFRRTKLRLQSGREAWIYATV